MIGVKRQHELMEEELSNSPQDVLCEDNSSESEESKHQHPNKRQKATEVWSISTAPIQATSMLSPLILSCTDTEALKKLAEIEKSELSNEVLSMKLQGLCTMFP